MLAILLTPVFFTIPMVVAGVIHMAAVKIDLLGRLNRPIHTPMFGRNKTWRGIWLMPLAGVVGVGVGLWVEPAFEPYLQARLSDFSPGLRVLLGLCLGLAYVLFELPNSWLKRKMGIPPGKLPTRNRGLFFALDHLDSTTGCVLVYFAFFNTAMPPSLLLTLGVGPLIHIGVNLVLYALRLRREPF